MIGLLIGYIFFFISFLLLDAKIRAFEDFVDNQYELNKAVGEALKNGGGFVIELSETVNKHLEKEGEIFEQMSNFLKEGEDKDGTL